VVGWSVSADTQYLSLSVRRPTEFGGTEW